MKRSQFVIAVFDDWDAVESLLASLGSDKIGRFGALLHTRTDEPPMQAVSWLVQDMTELHFAASRSRVRCTAGRLAAQLAMRSAGGARDLAHALRGLGQSGTGQGAAMARGERPPGALAPAVETRGFRDRVCPNGAGKPAPG